ncbi:MAG: S-methyl-5-thioribose-1-phosphate isomerase, partial [Candidatus Cloacimonetes bacterium]|nr:S-methyl-5-thioribose-1-phosphate isomerase [Candidatus Cloacimonadota bacterium]
MRINNADYRSVWWEHGRLKMIDQNRLPQDFVIAEFTSHEAVADAIRYMTVRGAPAIGAAGAFGLALAAQSAPETKFRASLKQARQLLITTRPTAVDLVNGVNYV